LGGGRLLIASVGAPSGDTLLAAAQARFTAFPRETTRIPSSSEELLRVTGLREENLQRDGRGQVVFVRHRLGLGGAVFFLPSANPEAVREEMKVLTDPLLAHGRPARADVRVWARGYEYIPPGAVPAARRRKVALYAIVGAACLIVALFFASGERRRFMCAGWTLGIAALLSAILARGFPVPELVTPSVELNEVAGDGRADRRTEWVLLEGTPDFAHLSVAGPEDGTLTPIHFREDELTSASTELSEQAGLRYRFRDVTSPPPTPLFQAVRVIEPPEPGRKGVTLGDQGSRVSLPPGGWWERVTESLRRKPAWGLLCRRDGSRVALPAPSAGPEGSTGRTEPSRDETGWVAASCPGLSESELKARSRALGDALDASATRRADVVVFCGEAAENDNAASPLVRLDGVRAEAGGRFVIWVLDVRTERSESD
jgi:hypothetical protein